MQTLYLYAILCCTVCISVQSLHVEEAPPNVISTASYNRLYDLYSQPIELEARSDATTDERPEDVRTNWYLLNKKNDEVSRLAMRILKRNNGGAMLGPRIQWWPFKRSLANQQPEQLVYH